MRSCLSQWLWLFFIGFSSQCLALYESEISLAQQWLSNQQNPDGSWGADNTARYMVTAEVVDAMRASGLRNSAYYHGITWLENHASDNADFQARRILSLGAHGDNMSAAIGILEGAQNTAISVRAAWGASAEYIQAPLDSALVLRGLSQSTTAADLQAAIDYLKSSQLSATGDQGWPVALESQSDAFSTAQVVKALVALQGVDPTVSTNIASAMIALGNLVDTNSPVYLQAHTAHAAYLAGDTTQANVLLSNLASTQDGSGSWNMSEYETALALRAFSAYEGLDTLANQSEVLVPDANLRASINQALGRNSMDGIDRAQLLQLTALVAVNQGIDDLTGLEYALNLTSADLRNNNITNTAPVDSLPDLVALQLSGNPVANGGKLIADEDIPTLPEWGIILLAAILLWQLYKRQCEQSDLPPSGGFAA